MYELQLGYKKNGMAYRIEDLIMKDKQWEMVFDLLYERQEILNMRSQKDWIEANDPKKQNLTY